jgi:uncharacterized RDD family membrane protein YckC
MATMHLRCLPLRLRIKKLCIMKRVGIGTRVLNCLVDTVIIALIAYGIYRVDVFYAMYYKAFFMPYYLWFDAILVVYYTFFEYIFKRTPGKWLSYTKVVTNNGGKPSFLQVFIRSLVRLTVIDCFFFPFLEKTLHDYLSKTEVVEV